MKPYSSQTFLHINSVIARYKFFKQLVSKIKNAANILTSCQKTDREIKIFKINTPPIFEIFDLGIEHQV